MRVNNGVKFSKVETMDKILSPIEKVRLEIALWVLEYDNYLEKFPFTEFPQSK